MPKYWVKNYFAHGRFPEVGQKQKTEKKKREEVSVNDVSVNDGQVNTWTNLFCGLRTKIYINKF